jgi:hypothetical protein
MQLKGQSRGSVSLFGSEDEHKLARVSENRFIKCTYISKGGRKKTKRGEEDRNNE